MGGSVSQQEVDTVGCGEGVREGRSQLKLSFAEMGRATWGCGHGASLRDACN